MRTAVAKPSRRTRPSTALAFMIAVALVAFTAITPAFAQPSPPESMNPASSTESGSAESSAPSAPSPSDATSAATDPKPEGEQAQPGPTDARAADSEPAATGGAQSGETNESGGDRNTADTEQASPGRADNESSAGSTAGGAALSAAPGSEAATATQSAAEPGAPAPETTAEAVEANALTVAIWSGAYGAAQRDVVIEGFKAERSVSVELIERKDKDPIDLMAEPGMALPDAAEFSAGEIDAGCKTGQLVKLSEGDERVIAPATAEDFIPGSLKPCGIGAFAWAHVIAVNPGAFEKGKPRNLAEAFDTSRFPGKRAFIKDPRFLMEAALMADGAKPDEVYDLLGSEEGRERAFAKLDSIRGDIAWFDSAKAAMQALGQGEAAVGQSFSGRAFFAAARGKPVDVIWDGQIYAITYWAIPARSPRQALARAFLEFATQPQQLAAVAQRFPYGPTRTSAVALAKRHVAAGLDLEAFLPTAPANMGSALASDDAWWAENREAMDAAFAAWMARPATEQQVKPE